MRSIMRSEARLGHYGRWYCTVNASDPEGRASRYHSAEGVAWFRRNLISLLLARSFAGADALRAQIGVNYKQLPKVCDAAPTSRVMVVAIMVSMVAFLESTVVNLALPATGRDLGGGLALQQWVIDGYLLALAATVYALIESHRHGWHDPVVAASMVVGVAALLAFVAWERRAPHPMVPLGLFTIRNFAGANLGTAFVYGALTLGSLGISLYTQEVAGYSATAAGLITLPCPVMSFLFARRVGGMAARIGPRMFVMAGPVLAGVGLLLIHPVAHGFNVVTQLLPGMIVLAAGMVTTITPLTAVNLSAVEPTHSGIAAAIQNAVGRTSALIATACVGLIAACTLTDTSFTRLLQVSAAVFFIGAVLSGVTITHPAASR